MNPKVFVGVAIVALAAVLGGILTMGSSLELDTQFESPETQTAPQPTEPLQIELDGITVTKVSQRNAEIEIAFKVTNPNPRSMIVTVMDYQLFETGYSNTEQISGGQIGNRAEGMVQFGSNYYTLLGGNSIILKDTIALKNSGNTPEFWSALESNSGSWRVSGDIFYNLSSMTSGQENELHFEFTQN